jgi:hypothetical protein
VVERSPDALDQGRTRLDALERIEEQSLEPSDASIGRRLEGLGNHRPRPFVGFPFIGFPFAAGALELEAFAGERFGGAGGSGSGGEGSLDSLASVGMPRALAVSSKSQRSTPLAVASMRSPITFAISADRISTSRSRAARSVGVSLTPTTMVLTSPRSSFGRLPMGPF